MRTRRLLVALAVAWAATAAPAAASMGRLVHNGIEMPIEGAVALWDAERPALTIHLLPFVPNPDEVHAIQTSKPFFFFELERASPNPELWPRWMPRATYQLSWSFDKETAGNHDTGWLFLYAFGIGEENSNLNVNATAGEHTGTLTGKMEPGATISLKASGETDLGDDHLLWEIDLSTELLAKLERE